MDTYISPYVQRNIQAGSKTNLNYLETYLVFRKHGPKSPVTMHNTVNIVRNQFQGVLCTFPYSRDLI